MTYDSNNDAGILLSVEYLHNLSSTIYFSRHFFKLFWWVLQNEF